MFFQQIGAATQTSEGNHEAAFAFVFPCEQFSPPKR
jgi:hypothetical protein